MKKMKSLLLSGLLVACFTSKAQTPVDSIKFFADDRPADMTLTTDIKKLQSEKKLEANQPASVVFRFPDSNIINENIQVYARGHFRRDFCTIPPLMLDFHNPTSPNLNQLGKLKLVIGCGSGSNDEELLLKEFLCYKIYNLLEEKSYRVRLVHVSYNDIKNKIKPFTQYAFMIEDISELAKRNSCIKKKDQTVYTESTDRSTMTMVAIFEYMISNGDWSVPVNHNIKLIWDKKNTAAPPFAVPYDFDHSGLVNASYAQPNELLGTETVRERAYRGFPRTMEELQTTFAVYKQKKDAIYKMIRDFTLLKDRTRKDIIDYLEEFYKTIDNNRQVQSIFIENARKN